MDVHLDADVRRLSSGSNNPFLRPTGDSCPIHKLPPNILSCLFEFVAADILDRKTTTEEKNQITSKVLVEHQREPDSESIDEVNVKVSTPWLPVSRVCRRWHNIATLTPSLWTDVIIPPAPTSSSFYRIEKQLERSKGLPIDIQINLEGISVTYSNDYPSSLVSSFYDLLLPEVNRWRSIEVRAGLGEDMHKIIDALFKTPIPIAPQLTSVELVCQDYLTHYLSRNASVSKQFVLFGASAPHLETVSITGMNVDWSQPWISAASNLTSLKIVYDGEDQCISWVEFAGILRGAPRLKVLDFENRCKIKDLAWVDPNLGIIPGDDSMIPLQLLELKQLDVRLQLSMMTQLLRRCYMPALAKLTIRPRYRIYPMEDPEEFEALVAQLVAPRTLPVTLPEIPSPHPQKRPLSLLASVQHLEISIVWRLGTERLSSLYDNLNQLTSLALRYTEHPAFIDLLFTPTGRLSDVKLPRLTSPSIQSTMHDWKVRDICALAWHRKDIGLPLKTLILRGVLYGKFPKDCLSWCQQNLETFYFTS